MDDPVISPVDERSSGVLRGLLVVLFGLAISVVVGTLVGGLLDGGIRGELIGAISMAVGLLLGAGFSRAARQDGSSPIRPARADRTGAATPARPPRETVDEETRDRIESEIAQGRTIEAIKLYREATGVGLREAKDAVEGWHRS